MTFKVSPDLTLPLQFVTHRNAVLAMSGAGKSNAVAVIAEEMNDAGAQWVLFDPKGDAWGLRAVGDGGPGLEVPIIGGDHGDVPLSPDAGTEVASLIAQGKLYGVVDVSDFSHDRQLLAQFMIDVATGLLRWQKTAVHLIFEEADEYLPQAGAGGRLEGKVANCVMAMKRLATKGRQKGIGFTIVSQRPALVNKTALYQCETLIALRAMGKRDRVAIREFVESHGEAEKLVESLPSLKDGEAWVWSPIRLGLMQCIRFRRRRTFDSGRTPEVGEAARLPQFSELNLDALKEALAKPAVHETASSKSDGRIAQLEAENARLRTPPNDGLLQQVTALQAQLKENHDWRTRFLAFVRTGLQDLLDSIPETGASDVVEPIPDSEPNAFIDLDADPPQTAPSVQAPKPPPAKREPVGDGNLSKCARLLLTALDQFGDNSLKQTATLAGYAMSGGVRNAAGELRAAECVFGANGFLKITKHGRTVVKNEPRLPRGKKLAEFWSGKLDKAARLMLNEIALEYPNRISMSTAAKRAGYVVSGGIRNACGELRTLNLVSGPNKSMLLNKALAVNL